MDDYRTAATAAADGPHIALPLGGIGTGNVALGADGGLRQWQLHNLGNHAGDLPGSFFALRVTRAEPPLDVTRILQVDPLPEPTGTPLVTDDAVPGWQRAAVARHGGVAAVEFAGTYPFATLRYRDDAWPLDVRVEAFTPLVPLDTDASSIPAALFTFHVRNTGDLPVRGDLGATLLNAVGWNGHSPVAGVAGAGLGGNTNRIRRAGGWTALVLENAGLEPGHPGAGQMVLAADDEHAPAYPQWRTVEEFLDFLRTRAHATGRARSVRGARIADPQRHARTPCTGPSPAGSTWAAGLAVRFDLAPGAERAIRVVICWTFPNRYVDFEQFGPPRAEWGQSRFWLGNHYTARYAEALDVLADVTDRFDALRAATVGWTSTLAASTLDDRAVRHLAAQLSLPRSPTCFRGADGRFYGFEGVLGASTVMWSGDVGGSCPLNCTHVWNYEFALARAFPDLERDMRRTEFEVMQAPEGHLPHRLIVPTYLRQMWHEPIGGPEEPALDGMLGAVLKTYREYRGGAGRDWLARYWPNVRRLLDHVAATWDPTDSGVLTGVQPSTHDIDLAGLNTFTGTLWLAALRAAEEMALRLDEPAVAARYRETFARGSERYDRELFNGEYYAHKLLPGDPTDFQWGDGCLSDQLVGQWWAHQLDLGHLLPADHVRSALSAVLAHNLRTGFRDHRHPYRTFADGDDTGLVLCSWPRGGRPAVPTRYADEVWTGVEYQVAAHCFWEGLDDEGRRLLTAVWDRYDGRRRNPFNEIECGDHYARAMAGWSALEAIAGLRHDAPAGSVRLRHAALRGARLPVLLSAGWGLASADGGSATLECRGGVIALRSLGLDGADLGGPVSAEVDGSAVAARVDGAVVAFPDGVSLRPGQALTVRLGAGA